MKKSLDLKKHEPGFAIAKNKDEEKLFENIKKQIQKYTSFIRKKAY